MAFRRTAMSLGGKLSLGYLLAANFFVCAGGRSWDQFVLVFGFPLLYALWGYEKVFGTIGPWRPAVFVPIAVLLWVGNAYFWGHTAAAVVRWWERRAGPSAG